MESKKVPVMYYPNTKREWDLAQKVKEVITNCSLIGMGNETRFVPELAFPDGEEYVGTEQIETFLNNYQSPPPEILAPGEPPVKKVI